MDRLLLGEAHVFYLGIYLFVIFYHFIQEDYCAFGGVLALRACFNGPPIDIHYAFQNKLNILRVFWGHGDRPSGVIPRDPSVIGHFLRLGGI